MSLFDSYFDYVEGTEPPLFMHRWCLIAGVGALLARQVWIPFGHTNIYPNNYVMLIGSPGTRKSTAINIIKNLCKLSGYDTFAGNRSSKEKFLEDLAGIDSFSEEQAALVGGLDNPTINNLFGDGITDGTVHEMFVAVDEFTNFVGTGNYEFISLLGELWDNLPDYKARVKNSKSPLISAPTVSLLSGNTSAGFAAAFPPEMIGQGFMSRLLLIHGERTDKRITWPRTPSVEDTAKMVQTLKLIRSTLIGECTMEPDAREALDKIYQTWQDLEDLRFKHYSTRRFTHLLKLCIIVAAVDLRIRLTLEDVILANSILTYTEHLMPKAMGEFGKSRFAPQNDKLLTHLAEAKETLSLQDLWKLMRNDLEKQQQLVEILGGLLQAEKIQRHGNGFLIKQSAIKKGKEFVDFKLLREAEGFEL